MALKQGLTRLYKFDSAYVTTDTTSSNKQNASQNMSYATSSPGATTGGQGNIPVSAMYELFCSQFLLQNALYAGCGCVGNHLRYMPD
ncbi:hypothetical protein ACJ73_09164 [Blastomyces percursus]|uniref:Uncharacterized protein n=1 Tax=Blastomyces percursus TaxID=1658174 RepID=A0A1J9PCM0_9EURO|nr:hypothetical protein ACJ73_09164 [Blastomyces percursus]